MSAGCTALLSSRCSSHSCTGCTVVKCLPMPSLSVSEARAIPDCNERLLCSSQAVYLYRDLQPVQEFQQ